jgi:P-type Na+/K+ transporter
VFRARAAVFAELTWLILISAWEFKAMRRSMFKINPHDTHPFPFFKDIWENQFLFWSVVIGALSVFPAVYIPGLNTSVFKHKGISWEWAPAIVCVFVFVSGMEAWKYLKTSMGWFEREETEGMKARRREGGALGLRQGFFTIARSFTKSKSEEKREDSDLSGISDRGRPLQRVKEEV